MSKTRDELTCPCLKGVETRTQSLVRTARRETLSEILGPVSQEATTVVLAGSTAGGVGAFNAARWVLETFDQVGGAM